MLCLIVCATYKLCIHYRHTAVHNPLRFQVIDKYSGIMLLMFLYVLLEENEMLDAKIWEGSH